MRRFIREAEGLAPDDPSAEQGLIAGILNGDTTAMLRLDGWIDVVLVNGFRALHPEWEDLRQDIRIRILRNLRAGHFNGRSSLRTYVHRIAKNTAIDFIRRDLRRQERVPDREKWLHPAGDRQWSSPWLAQDLLERVLRDLTEEDRILVRLVFAEQYSYQEIAAMLGIPEGTVKSRMARCKERILLKRRQLKDH